MLLQHRTYISSFTANTFSKLLALTVRICLASRAARPDSFNSPFPQRQPDQTLVRSPSPTLLLTLILKRRPQLPELHRLLQVHCCQGRRLCPMQAVQEGLQFPLPQCVLPFRPPSTALTLTVPLCVYIQSVLQMNG